MSQGDTPVSRARGIDTTTPSAVPAPSSDGDVLEARALGERYEILALAGRGGMGNVYKAYDRVLDETVALKTLRRELVGDPVALERFRSEVKLARRVTHRNVARTFDTGVEEGIAFLTMEFVVGEPLDARLARERRLSIDAAIGIAQQICDALAAAHSARVIHRDLKPQNVIVERSGRVVLTDFGIARAGEALAHATGANVMGTPAYMAPEQVEGLEIGPAADIFALGMMLFEMLTGELPFRGNTPMAIAAARLVRPPPDPRSLRDGIPDSLASLVLKCLARSPNDRPEDAAAIARALSTAATAALPAQSVRSHAAGPGLAVESGRERTVAVLPFRVRGAGEQSYAHLAEGLAEELIDGLSLVGGVKVRPLGAVLPHIDGQTDPREIGRALGVQVVVDGTVRLVGDQIHGRVALVSVAEGFQLFAERFEGDTASIFSTVARATSPIARALLGERFVAPRRSTSSPEAVDCYLRARHALRLHWYEGTERAVELFDRARELAPDDPRVLSGAAIAAARRTFRDVSRREWGMREAEELATRAIRAAPEWPEPYVALAIVDVNRNRFGAALAGLQRALARAPDDILAHDIAGQLRLELGPLDRAIAHLKAALELDPGQYKSRWELSRGYAFLGDWDRSYALLAIDVSDSGQAKIRDATRSRMDLWRMETRFRDALAGYSYSDDPIAGFIRARVDVAASGVLEPSARAYVEQTLARAPTGSRYQLVLLQFVAELFAGAGLRDDAVALIERAAASSLQDRLWLERCPLFDPLRGEPRFVGALDVVRKRTDEILESASGAHTPASGSAPDSR